MSHYTSLNQHFSSGSFFWVQMTVDLLDTYDNCLQQLSVQTSRDSGIQYISNEGSSLCRIRAVKFKPNTLSHRLTVNWYELQKRGRMKTLKCDTFNV